MKTYDVFIGKKRSYDIGVDGAKVYDIQLGRRVRGCDLIVYSMPFREDMSAINRIVLKACVEEYSLIKLIAGAENRVDLVSHVDAMLKIANERIESLAILNANVELIENVRLHPEETAMLIDVALSGFSEETFEHGDNAIEIGIDPIPLQSTVGIELDDADLYVVASSVQAMAEKFISARCGTDIGVGLDALIKMYGERFQNGVAFGVDTIRLLVGQHIGADNQIVFGAGDVDIETFGSVGRMSANIIIGAEETGGSVAEKRFGTSSEIAIGADAHIVEDIYLEPDGPSVVIGCDVDFVLRRLRMVTEADVLDRTTMDGMPLTEVDYITVD